MGYREDGLRGPHAWVGRPVADYGHARRNPRSDEGIAADVAMDPKLANDEILEPDQLITLTQTLNKLQAKYGNPAQPRINPVNVQAINAKRSTYVERSEGNAEGALLFLNHTPLSSENGRPVNEPELLMQAIIRAGMNQHKKIFSESPVLVDNGRGIFFATKTDMVLCLNAAAKLVNGTELTNVAGVTLPIASHQK